MREKITNSLEEIRQAEYFRIDRLKEEILSDPIYSKCPICSRKIRFKLDFTSWYNGGGAWAQIVCGRRFFPHVKSIECGKSTMSRAIGAAFESWKIEYNKIIPIRTCNTCKHHHNSCPESQLCDNYEEDE